MSLFPLPLPSLARAEAAPQQIDKGAHSRAAICYVPHTAVPLGAYVLQVGYTPVLTLQLGCSEPGDSNAGKCRKLRLCAF